MFLTDITGNRRWLPFVFVNIQFRYIRDTYPTHTRYIPDTYEYPMTTL